MRKASFHGTPFSSPAEAMSLSPTPFERVSTAVTVAVQPTSSPALTSSRLSNPTSWTISWTMKEAVSPPSAAPPPMNPKKRFACRGS